MTRKDYDLLFDEDAMRGQNKECPVCGSDDDDPDAHEFCEAVAKELIEEEKEEGEKQ